MACRIGMVPLIFSPFTEHFKDIWFNSDSIIYIHKIQIDWDDSPDLLNVSNNHTSLAFINHSELLPLCLNFSKGNYAIPNDWILQQIKLGIVRCIRYQSFSDQKIWHQTYVGLAWMPSWMQHSWINHKTAQPHAELCCRGWWASFWSNGIYWDMIAMISESMYDRSLYL